MHAAGESKTDLAAGIGLTQPKVSRRQLGRTSWTLADCDALAAHYGMNVLQLLAGPTAACEALPPERRRSSGTSRLPAPAAGQVTPAGQPRHPKPPPPDPAGTPPTPTPTPAHPQEDEPPDTTGPCILCGRPATEQIEGFPQHLDQAECARAAARTPAPLTGTRPEPAGETPGHTARTAPGTGHREVRSFGQGMKVVSRGGRAQAASERRDVIGEAVAASLAAHGGDAAAAQAALVRRAIPDAMTLLDECRKGGRYDIVAHPWLPEILHKQTSRGPDQIWEARPGWTRPELPPGTHKVTTLDVNAYYLSAMKTHLPLGRLEHSTSPHHDRRRAGAYLITPPAWDHGAMLPNPIGSRDEPGPLWVTEPTLRLLLRLSGPRYGLCDPPRIHESWTSGCTEGLLESFRTVLKEARDKAIAGNDTLTEAYLKAMYSKFVSTMGESAYNRELHRTDWMHIIRSQAFANLWWRAYKAHDEGLTVVSVQGTDELHVIGDWRTVFTEGRGLTEMKVKDVYTIGTGPESAEET
ncbi:transcriptional regulator [Streptomyces sp. NPDC090499]|uniref:transcriptional regulator n=1 Tax=Streptomyces sp. NPDC090499 TaxID=3365965 RepID=UPI00381D891B